MNFKLFLVAFFVATGVLPISDAAEWPQWRGVHRDAKIPDEGLMRRFPADGLEVRWSVPIGSGYSGPTVAGGRVFVMDKGPGGPDSRVERVLCFDADSGVELWQHEYGSVYSIGYVAGPRASVTVDSTRAYSVGAMGHFHCFDAASGDVVWARDLAADYDIEMPIWGITASPLVFGNRVIQITGGRGACVVAMDKNTGEELWRSVDEKAGYSSPVMIRQGDLDVVVCWTGESLSGLNAADGSVLWRIEMLPRNMPIGVPTPVVHDDLLFVSSFYDGSLLVRFDRKRPTAETLWRRVGQSERNTDALHAMISGPVIKGGHIYGADSYGQLRCLDLFTGDRVWEDLTVVPKARWATLHIIQAGDREIIQNDRGDLVFGKLTPDAFEESDRTHLIDPTRSQLNRRDGVVWAHPAIAGGMIFARNDKELRCASLRSETREKTP